MRLFMYLCLVPVSLSLVESIESKHLSSPCTTAREMSVRCCSNGSLMKTRCMTRVGRVGVCAHGGGLVRMVCRQGFFQEILVHGTHFIPDLPDYLRVARSGQL